MCRKPEFDSRWSLKTFLHNLLIILYLYNSVANLSVMRVISRKIESGTSGCVEGERKHEDRSMPNSVFTGSLAKY